VATPDLIDLREKEIALLVRWAPPLYAQAMPSLSVFDEFEPRSAGYLGSVASELLDLDFF
jgi:hypothetical protein